LDSNQSLPKMSSARSRHQPGGVNVVYCDGHVAWISNNITLATGRAISTTQGGETIGN
jgi:prepilin-type processing-associated H-X9-DG protein